MYTVEQIFSSCMDIMNKKTVSGTIDSNGSAFYRARALGILNMWSNEISKNGDLYKTFEVGNKPSIPLGGQFSGFDYLEYIGTEIIKEYTGSAKNYYFEVDGESTVYIEDFNGTWNTLATITVPNTVTSFTAYKSTVTPSSGATKSRIRFGGAYRYLITNYALFSIPFAPTKIPSYRPWVKHELPSDFKSMDQIIDEFPSRQYTKDSTFKWEQRKDLYINYYYEGNVRVVYKSVPVQITAFTQTLEIDEITSMSGVYFLSAHLLLQENTTEADFFLQRYNELKLESNVKQPTTSTDIIDVYSITSSSWGD